MTDTTPRPSWATLPLDQAMVLPSAAIRLSDDFRGVFGPETIERFLHSSFDQFASRATVPTFLPLMAERFARQRLRALAKVEGLHDDGKPTVLFLCVHNAGRSQMAMGFFQHLAGDAAVCLVRRKRTRHRRQPRRGQGQTAGTLSSPSRVRRRRHGRTRHRYLQGVPWTRELRSADARPGGLALSDPQAGTGGTPRTPGRYRPRVVTRNSCDACARPGDAGEHGSGVLEPVRGVDRLSEGAPVFVLLRHAHAVAKRAWDGRDLDRPLSEQGLRQAQALVGSLSGMPLRRLLTSPALRCAQTLEPLAHHLDLAIESTSLLARDSEAPLVAQLAEDPRSEDALLCTHGETLAAVFRHWQIQGHLVLTPPAREIRKNMTQKSGGWLVEANSHLQASYFPPPNFPDLPTSSRTHG